MCVFDTYCVIRAFLGVIWVLSDIWRFGGKVVYLPTKR